jgi:hypothetical protein
MQESVMKVVSPNVEVAQVAGTWHNQHGSEINLVILDDGRITGTFRSGVGPAGQEAREFALTGFARNGVLSFCVDFERHDSMTAWVGQVTGFRCDKIDMMWHMVMNTHCDQSRAWRSVMTGSDMFARTQSDDYLEQEFYGVSHPMWHSWE